MKSFVSNGSSCPLCERSSLRRFRAFAHDAGDDKPGLDVVECRRCGFAWQWPIARADEESQAFFRSSYRDAEVGTYFDPEKRRRTAKLELDLLDSLTARGTLLDVGAGSGTFARSATERGWRVTGLDPVAEQMTSETSIEMITGTIDDLSEEREFDVVCLWSIVEHVADPLTLLRKSTSHVAPSGALVLATPNYQSADRIIGGADWWAYQLDHVWYHGPSALRTLMEEAGLADVVVAGSALRPWVKDVPAYVGPSPLEHLKEVVRRPHRAMDVMARYLELRRCARDWPEWSGLPRVALAGRRPAHRKPES